jgi:chromosomal replication initiation ATPase DnaA
MNFHNPHFRAPAKKIRNKLRHPGSMMASILTLEEVDPTKPVRPSIRHTLVRVSEVTGYEIVELAGKGRMKGVRRARQIAYYLLRECGGRSYPVIGNAMGARDHSTVIHGVRRVKEDREEFEPELSELLRELPLLPMGGKVGR